MPDLTETRSDDLAAPRSPRNDALLIKEQLTELERKLNVFSSQMMAEVIRIDTKIDTQGLETIRQQTVYQQNMAKMQEQFQSSTMSIQSSLSTIIAGFGLDRGADGADALRRDLIWLRDSREASKHSKGVVWETVIKWLVPTLLMAMLYGLLTHAPVLGSKP